jgi:hypothetical protein
MNQTNQLTVHTRPLPVEWTSTESREAARALLLCYRDGQFTAQTFFTQPLLGRINWVDGLKHDAQVYFREINRIGIDVFHVRLTGTYEDVRKMCRQPEFYTLLRGIDTTLSEDVGSRWYIDTTIGKGQWDIIVDLDSMKYHLANYVTLQKARARIDNVVVVGDRLLGRTSQREMVIGKLPPDVIEQDEYTLEVELYESINKLGKVDSLARVPNSDALFLVSIENRVYQFDLWGAMTRFQELDERVKQINSINFNRVRSVLATGQGLFEVDVQEMPNMARATGLPRQIAHSQLLQQGFKVARYIEDPLILGVSPAMTIVAKTKDEKVFVC